MKIFEIIFTNPLLNNALNWIIQNNTSNFLPYHNLYHLLTVAENCNEGANYYAVSENEKVHLLLAALFHDVYYIPDHSKKDMEKIALAVKAVYEFREQTPPKLKEITDWKNVEEIIRATEFPHIYRTDRPLIEQIIQDADLMQVFAPNPFLQVIVGLAQETGKSVAQMIKSQKDFLYNITWNTKWARLVFEEKINQVEEDIALWQKLYL